MVPQTILQIFMAMCSFEKTSNNNTNLYLKHTYNSSQQGDKKVRPLQADSFVHSHHRMTYHQFRWLQIGSQINMMHGNKCKHLILASHYHFQVVPVDTTECIKSAK